MINMNINTYFVLIVVGAFVRLKQVKSEMYINDTLVSLRKEAVPCRLAVPDITYTHDGPTVTLPPDLNISENDEIWVGYMSKLQVFEYVGCVSQEDIENIADETHQTESDLGQCFSACKHQLFGIYGNTCYCTSVRVYTLKHKRNGCDALCDQPADVVCGGVGNGTLYVSVYRSVYGDLLLGDDGENCGLFKPSENKLSWTACQTYIFLSKFGLCQNDTTYIKTWQFFSSWKDYTMECFQMGYTPAVGALSEISDINSYVWIGRTKSYAISIAEPLSYENPNIGYISKDDNVYRLKFSTSVSKTKKTLCIKVDSSETTTVDNSTEGANGEAANDFRNADDSLEDNNNNTLVGVYIGVPTALAAVLVMIALVVLWRRHKGHSTGKDTHAEATTAVTNAAYEDDVVKSTPDQRSQENDYYNLDTNNATNANQNSKPVCDNDSEYDTTNAFAKKNSNGVQEGNVYNTLGEKLDETYDQTGNGPRSKAKLTTPAGLQCMSDDTYNHVLQDDGYGTMADTRSRSDDTYSHAHY